MYIIGNAFSHEKRFAVYTWVYKIEAFHTHITNVIMLFTVNNLFGKINKK